MRPTQLPCLLLAVLASCHIHFGGWDHADKHTIGGLAPVAGTVERVRIDLNVADVKIVPGKAGQLRWHGTCRVEYDDWGTVPESAWRPLVREADGVVELTHDKQVHPARHQVSFDLTIEVPPELPLEATVGVGDVEVQGQVRPVRIATGVGDVSLADCRGEARLRSGVGDVSAVRHDGSVDAASGVGDVEVEMREGGSASELRLHTGVGDVDVRLARDQGRSRSSNGPRIDASAGTGEVSIRSR